MKTALTMPDTLAALLSGLGEQFTQAVREESAAEWARPAIAGAMICADKRTFMRHWERIEAETPGTIRRQWVGSVPVFFKADIRAALEAGRFAVKLS